MLDVLDVELAGDDADDAFVNVELPSPRPRELPLGGDDAEAAAEDLEELPGGEVRPDAPLLVPGVPIGVGLFLDVDVVKSCGDATLVEDVESAYLQLDVDDAAAAAAAAAAEAACNKGAVGSTCIC